MRNSIFLIFSHKLTDSQIKDLERMGISNFEYLPSNLQTIWSSIPPDVENLNDYLRPIFEWVKSKAKSGDWVLVQGDFGAVCLVVDFCFKNYLVPVYATTKRNTTEKMENGKLIKVSEFKHVIFRRYER